MPVTNKNVVTTSRIDHPINIYFQRKFLKTLDPLLIYAKFGQDAILPQHEGDTYKWRRYAALAAATTPLDEVNDPAPSMPQKNDLSCSVRQYGGWIKTSAWRDMTGLTQDKDAMTERLSQQSRLTLDVLCREVIAGGASNTTCTNGTPTPTLLNKIDIQTVVKNLMTENATMITSRIRAGVGQGTSPIRESFICISHTNLLLDWEAVSGWKNVANYAPGGTEYPGEIGSVGNIRVILTSNAYTSSGNYYNVIISQDAYGSLRISGGEKPLIYTPPDRTGSALQMYGMLGWKIPYACRILNDVLIHTLICTSNY